MGGLYHGGAVVGQRLVYRVSLGVSWRGVSGLTIGVATYQLAPVRGRGDGAHDGAG